MDPQFEALLAWRISQALEKLSSLLFDRYERAFQGLDRQEEEARMKAGFFSIPAPTRTDPATSLEEEGSQSSSLPPCPFEF